MMLSLLAILLHYFSISDYQCFIVDFLLEYFIREGIILIIQLEMYRLTTSKPNTIQNYLLNAEASFQYYKTHERYYR